MSQIKRYIGPGARNSRAVAHDGRVYTVAIAAVKSKSLGDQTRQALASIDKNLAEAGTSKSHLLSVTVYITSMADKAEMNDAWDAWIDPDNRPQRACVGAVLEGEDLVEIVAVAALP